MALAGIQFPDTGGGKRSTTVTGRQIFAAALGPVVDIDPQARAAQAAIQKLPSKKWRYGYMPHACSIKLAMMRQGLKEEAGREVSMKMATAALTEAHDVFEFYRANQKFSLLEAMSPSFNLLGKLDTGCVRGCKAFKPFSLSVPFEGKQYEGDSLRSLLTQWVNEGRAEPSFATSLHRLLDHSEWFDLRGHAFVLLGGTAEMGPLKFLLQCGATVVVVARKNSTRQPEKWSDLLHTAHRSCGTLYFPLTKQDVTLDANSDADSIADAAAYAGADVLTEAPELAAWLSGLLPESTMHVGSYIYLDGEAFVRATMAMDAIVQAMLTRRNPGKTALMYIDSPATPHVVPRSTQKRSILERESAPSWQKILELLGVLKRLKFLDSDGNVDSGVVGPDTPAHSSEYVLVDSIASFQGPNYCLAKSLQQFRAMTALAQGWWRETEKCGWYSGVRVSVNNGPGAKTVSVMHSPTVATAARNMSYFKPNVLYDPATVVPLMSSLLVHDVRAPLPSGESQHPLMTIYAQAWPGGMWTTAYSADTIGRVAYLMSVAPRLVLFALVAITFVSFVFSWFGIAGLKFVVVAAIMLWVVRHLRRRPNRSKKGK